MTSDVAEQLDRAEELVHSDPTMAHQLTVDCEGAAARLGLPQLTARARYLRARVLAERGEFDAALTLIEQARSGWWQDGAHVSALRTDLGRMQVLDDLGRHEDAAKVGESMVSALDSLSPTGDEEEQELRGWLRAAALENLGVACGFIGQQDRALEAYSRAEAAYQALGMPEEVARPRANRGIELLELGRAREALAALRAAAVAFTAAGDRLWSAKCDGHIADAHRQLGAPVRALRLLQRARRTLIDLGATADAIRLQLVIANTYLGLGLYTEALTEATEIAAATAELGMRHDTGTAQFAIGLAQLGSGNLEASKTAFQAAAEAFEAVGDVQLRARLRLAEAELAAADHAHHDAAELVARAADELRTGGWLVPQFWATLRQADLAADDQAASVHLDQASELLGRISVAPLRYPYLLRKARLLSRAGDVQPAEAMLREAIDSVDELTGGLSDHVMRTAFRADRLAAYDELLELLVDRGDLAEACQVSDRAKARTLVDLLAGADPIATSSNDPALRDVLTDLNATYSKLLTADGAHHDALRNRATALEQRARALRLRHLPSSTGMVTGMVTGTVHDQPHGPAVEGTRLTYHVIGNDVLAFVARGDTIRSERMRGILPSVQLDLERLASQWARFRIGGRFTRRHADTLLATSNDILGSLYQQLVAPLSDELEATVGTDLVIVPHRQLSQVPFHALYDGTDHLLRRWSISVAPTMAGQQGARAGPDLASAPVLVVATPHATTPSVSVEAKALAALLPATQVLLGEEATVAALRAAVPGPAAVHIACHGLYRPANPMFSSLRLADGWITSAEVLELDLGGALVTLSACESGRHDLECAEPVGLAWAFLAAGASGVIVSQWLVDDAVTLELMTELYRALSDGQLPADALRHAQLVAAGNHPHPFHWAPFTYVVPPAVFTTGDRHAPH